MGNFSLGKLAIPTDAHGNPAALLCGVVKVKHLHPVAGEDRYEVVPVDVSRYGAMAVRIKRGRPAFQLMHTEIDAESATWDFPTKARGYNAAGCSQLVVDVVLHGEDAAVTLLPLAWNDLLEMYVASSPREFSTYNSRVVLDLCGSVDVYLLPIHVQGKVTVAVAGV